MPKLREVKAGTTKETYYQETTCRRCVLAALRTVRLGLIDVRNEANTTEIF